MRWFDLDFISGGLSDDEWTARQIEYAAHLDSIRSRLADGTEQLLSAVYLHDGQVANWAYEPGVVFVMRVLTGDLQRGYEWLTLTYGDASLCDASEADLRRWWPAGDLPNEIVDEEVDLLADHSYEHRMLLWPEGVVSVRFRSLTVAREPADPADRR